MEPTLDPREFRVPAPGNGKRHSVKLTADEAHRLKSTLSELLELKRLLDQSR